MRVVVFNAKSWERKFLEEHPLVLEGTSLELEFLHPRLDTHTAKLAAGFDAVCLFVNDVLTAPVLEILAAGGTHCVLLRCSGYHNVDLEAATRLGMRVLHVPSYSPHGVAEFATALLLAVNRKTHRAYTRVRDGNFETHGLMGFDLSGKTVGVIGTGRVGSVFCNIMRGFSARVVAYDISPQDVLRDKDVEYVDLDELFDVSDIIAVFCPLLPNTRHIINAEAIAKMKKGVVLINVSRGELVCTEAVIAGIHEGKIGGLGIDVYEGEGDLFFDDHSGDIIRDVNLIQLQGMPNVIITPHIAFCTETALINIWKCTAANASEFEKARRSGLDASTKLPHQVNEPSASKDMRVMLPPEPIPGL